MKSVLKKVGEIVSYYKLRVGMEGSGKKGKRLKRTLGRNVMAGQHKVKRWSSNCEDQPGLRAEQASLTAQPKAKEIAAQQPRMICTETGKRKGAQDTKCTEVHLGCRERRQAKLNQADELVEW